MLQILISAIQLVILRQSLQVQYEVEQIKHMVSTGRCNGSSWRVAKSLTAGTHHIFVSSRWTCSSNYWRRREHQCNGRIGHHQIPSRSSIRGLKWHSQNYNCAMCTGGPSSLPYGPTLVSRPSIMTRSKPSSSPMTRTHQFPPYISDHFPSLLRSLGQMQNVQGQGRKRHIAIHCKYFFSFVR